MTVSSLRGPELLLRTQRVVSPESPIFHYARKGDTSGIRRLLTSGEASIFDVTEDDGASALGVNQLNFHPWDKLQLTIIAVCGMVPEC
jgi:hypothetical protein